MRSRPRIFWSPTLPAVQLHSRLHGTSCTCFGGENQDCYQVSIWGSTSPCSGFFSVALSRLGNDYASCPCFSESSVMLLSLFFSSPSMPASAAYSCSIPMFWFSPAYAGNEECDHKKGRAWLHLRAVQPRHQRPTTGICFFSANFAIVGHSAKTLLEIVTVVGHGRGGSLSPFPQPTVPRSRASSIAQLPTDNLQMERTTRVSWVRGMGGKKKKKLFPRLDVPTGRDSLLPGNLRLWASSPLLACTQVHLQAYVPI